MPGPPMVSWCSTPTSADPATTIDPLRRMTLLTHPMLDQLAKLGLSGMAQAFAELEASGEGTTLTHADWLGLLVDREMTHRRDKAPGCKAALCPVAPPRRRRGRRLPGAARPRSGAVPQARRRR